MSIKDQTHQKENSWKMFNEISSSYDKVNRAMTGFLDILWRKKVGAYLPDKENMHLLDCATGTADQLLSLLKDHSNISYGVGIDLAENMLAIGRKKIENSSVKERAELKHASALEIPFADESFDCVTMSFGIRNVSCVPLCLAEIYRVMRPGARLLILETSLPDNGILKKLHLSYIRNMMPNLAKILSKKIEPYRYLNETIESFPYGKTFCNLLEIHQFTCVKAHPLMLGAVSIYQADKPV